jgi:hypothetical protein
MSLKHSVSMLYLGGYFLCRINPGKGLLLAAIYALNKKGFIAIFFYPELIRSSQSIICSDIRLNSF